MAQESPPAGIPPNAPTVAPTVVATGSLPPRTAASTCQRIAFPFSEARQLSQAHQILVKNLDQLTNVLAVVHYCEDGDGTNSGVAQGNLGDHTFRAVWLRSDASGGGVGLQSEQLVSLCRQSLLHGTTQHRRRLSPDRVYIAVPARDGQKAGDVIGVIAAPSQGNANLIAGAERIVEQFAVWLLRSELKRQSEIAHHAAATTELVCRALGCENLRDGCQVIVTELAKHLNLRRAAIGVRRNQSRHVQLIALSDSTRIDSSTSHARMIESVMDESLLFSTTLVAGKGDVDQAAGRSAGDLAREQAGIVIAVPLTTDDSEIDGAFVAILDPAAAVQETRLFLDAAAPALATVLGVSDRHGASRIARMVLQGLRSKAGAVAIGAAIVFAAAMFIPIRHRETCPAIVEPNVKRFVAAPFDATLKECRVAPGDLVRQGEVLATLDGRELQWKRDSLQADHDQATKKRDAAQASREYAEQRIAQLEVESLRFELDLLDHRMQALQLQSPIDGIIVAGDLNRAKGVPLTTGQSLFEVAPMDQMLIEVAVSEDQIAYVAKNQSVKIHLNAYPQRHWQATVRGVNPRSEIRDDENVFIAECTIDDADQVMRPGMKGSVKIDCGRQSLGWVLFHRPVEALGQWLWW
ncbi:MAG: efflux RND transporter periplasmic adaptor subunit [Planctomycetales bacterium]|nr:efflux RND transporter periplasmic adaptor subunit [Planctomycetales bacterium]